MDNYLTLKDAEATINDWKARAERAEAESQEARSNVEKCLRELSDMVKQRDATKAENARLREALDRLVTMCAEAGIGDWKGDYCLGKLTETGKLRAELNTAKAEVERLRKALLGLWNDCTASDFNEHWESYITAKQALAGKEGE